MKNGLLIGWVAAGLLGLSLVVWALWFLSRAGSYLVMPEIVGLLGLYITFQGILNARRIIKNIPPTNY